MAVKRNPDIEYYKTNYEKWKKETKEFINDIKSGKKSYYEFDEWLDKNNKQQVLSYLLFIKFLIELLIFFSC